MNPKSRIAWIDVARGIGIILVIYGHALDTHSIQHLIYAFHMPLFFFLSGIVFHHKAYDQFFPFLKKTFNGILRPYFMYAFVTFGLWVSVAPNVSMHTIVRQFESIFYGNGADGLLVFDNVLWFLPCLFVTRLMFYGVTTMTVNVKKIAIVLFGFSILGYIISQQFPKLILPFGTEIALTGIVYFGLGYLWNTQTEYWKEKFRKHAKYIFGISLLICIAVAQFNYIISGHHIDLRSNQYDHYVLFYTAAISGILSTLALSIWVYQNRMLEYMGKRTMILFVWHLVLFEYMGEILVQYVDVGTHILLRNLVFAPIFTILAMGAILGIDRLIYISKARFLPRKTA